MNFCNCPNCATENCPNAEDWIDIRKRQPEKGQVCIVTDGEFMGLDAYLGSPNGIVWRFVTHWQPAPELPKETA